MYLFARRTVVRGQDALKWSVDIGAAAAAGLNAEVGVWANAFSPGVGTITWTSRWPDLGTLGKSLEGLLSDAKYLALVAEGQNYVNGAIDDTLFQIVYEGSAPTSDAKYASTVSAVCAPGNFGRGMMSGLEIAQKAEQSTGVSTAFLAAQTGPYGAVSWLAGYDGIEAFEAAQHKLEADMSFIEFLDGVTGAYVADPMVTRSTLYMRVN
ncbi:MAG: hypothetical protein WA580_03510 [Acidimicrobiales bacterium]